jgi:arylamine N-acetyltransferase
MAHPLSHRPQYTDDQLSQYLSLLFSRSDCFRTLSTLKEKLKTDPLATLTTLQKYHLGTVPWGDVSLHYSTDKIISLDAEDLFQKIVVKRHGGYCMEVNTLYAAVLRSLGVKLYTTGARISNNVDSPGKKDPAGFGGL